MLFFLLLITMLIVLIGGATYWALGEVFSGATLLWCRRGLVLFDALAVIGLFLAPHLTDLPYAGGLLRFLSMVAMGQFFLTVFVAVGVIAAKLIPLLRETSAPFDAERRTLLKGAILYPLAAAGAGLYGGLVGVDDTVEREFSIPVKNLPVDLQGFRVAQLSDIHLGKFFSLEKLHSLLERCAAAHPDALLLTGDVFDDVDINAEASKLIDGFCPQFPHGIWYCFGNHEHFRGAARISSYLKDTNIHVLVNSATKIIESERPLYFAGVDYPMNRNAFDADKSAYTAEALAAVPKDAVVILLAHHPEFIDDAAENDVALTLTGHTHGSQVGFFGRPLFPVFKYTRGLIKIKDSYGYVHCGNGSWFPYRLGCPPEIAYFTLSG